MSMTTKISISLIIGDNENNIRFVIGFMFYTAKVNIRDTIINRDIFPMIFMIIVI